jgi:hypothetical protein
MKLDGAHINNSTKTCPAIPQHPKYAARKSPKVMVGGIVVNAAPGRLGESHMIIK